MQQITDNLYINNECIEAYNETAETPKFLHDHNGNKAFHLQWHDTDGWRGYYEVKALKNSGWSKIDYDGWITGNWDDAPEEAKESTVDAKLRKLAKEYELKGYEVEAVFALTSNVFSTVFDVFVRKIN
jgi:hypothetical protein